MTVFYVFNEYGDFQFTTTDEDYASVWCDNNEGYYCTNKDYLQEEGWQIAQPVIYFNYSKRKRGTSLWNF